MIKNWGKINRNLKYLIKAYDNPYFNLMEFCSHHNLNYRDILGFIAVGKSILSDDLDISNELKYELRKYESIAKQLELINIF